MVVTLLVTGVPRFVSLTVLSYNLDSILSTDEVGKFRLREYTEVSNRHREVFVDFNSGFDAMCAQELLHDFELISENGSHNKLKAWITGSSPSKLPSLSPPHKRRARSRERHSLIPYGLSDSVGFSIDNRLEMLEKYKKVVKAETELVYLKRKLRKEKKKYTRQQIESSETSDSNSSSERNSKKRKKKSKIRSKSEKRSKSLKKPYRTPRSPSQTPCSGATQSSSDHEASCSFTRNSKSQDNILSRTSQGRIVRSSSKELPPNPILSLPSTSLRTPTRSSSHHSTKTKPLSIRNTSRSREDKRKILGSRRSRTPIGQTSRSPNYRIRHPKSRSPKFRTVRSRSRSRKLRPISASPKPSRKRSRSKSGSPGYRNVRNRFRKYSRSRSCSRHRYLKSPGANRRDTNRSRSPEKNISPHFSTHNRRDENLRGNYPLHYKKKLDNQANIISDNIIKNRITELGSGDEATAKRAKTKILSKEKPVLTDEDHIVILNKLEEASKSIVNEINIAVSFKHVAQLKVLNLKEKEQAITLVKKYVDDYLRQLIPESMALAMTVVGIVRNFRVLFSKEEENKLVEGIINNIIRDREKANVVVKTENSPILASDWRAVDDLLRDIENEDQTEKPSLTDLKDIEKPEKRISLNPIFFLPVKKIIKQMMAHIDQLDFKNDDNLQFKFMEKIRNKIKERISKLLVGKEFVPTNKIVEIYRENYHVEGDLSLVNEVYILIVKSGDEDEESTDNIKSACENAMEPQTNACTDSKVIDNGSNEDCQNVQIKQEDNPDITPDHTIQDDVTSNKITQTRTETNTEEGQCNVKIIITTIIKKEIDE